MTQVEALNILKTGANVFLTGEPGSGKTHTINQYVHYLREHNVEPAITASTGIAATHIHGQTIHSWAGLGVRRYLSEFDLDTIASTEYLVKRVRATNVLIIDEVSMIDGNTLQMVDEVCRAIKHKNEPFGGIQMVLVGDFFQLPPISRAREELPFAFQSNVWRELSPLVCYLSEQYRQEDEQFLALLSAIRSNEYGESHHDLLTKRFIEKVGQPVGDKVITKLFSHNANVDELNTVELSKISSPIYTFNMIAKGREALVTSLKKGCLSPEKLELKVGAIVMCTKNSREKGFINGTLATISGFESGTYYPIIKTRSGRSIVIEPMDWNIEEQGKIKASITQVPLRLAWAITIHKSQGMSLDAAVMDLRQVFEYGQGYVALSRVRSLKGLYLLGVNERTFQVHPLILAADESLRANSAYTTGVFVKMDKAKIIKMQENFLIANGGLLDVVKTPKTKKVLKSGHKTESTCKETLKLVKERVSLSAIVKGRKLTSGTILGHLEKLAKKGELVADDIKYLLPPPVAKALRELENAFKHQGTALAPLYEHYQGKYSFDELRLVRIIFLTK